MTFEKKREELATILIQAGDTQFQATKVRQTLTELNDRLNAYNQKIEKLKRECFELQAKEAKNGTPKGDNDGNSEEAAQDVPSTPPQA